MLGFVLVSNKNKIILLDGDEEFFSTVNSKISKEIHAEVEIASTSSGIFTDSTESSVVSRRSNSPQTATGLIEATHVFLPLISLYRASGSRSEPYKSLACDSMSVAFEPLANDFLVISIGPRSNRRQLILNYLMSSIHANVGGLMEMIDSELPLLLSAKEAIGLHLEKCLSGENVHKAPFISSRRTVFYRNQLNRLFPLLRSISSQLMMFLGSNRCLLLSHGTLLSTVNSISDDRPLPKFIAMSDLHILLDQLNTMPPASKRSDVFQMWIRPPNYQVPYFVNVIRYRLAEHVTLVCLSQAKNIQLIRLLSLLLLQLEQLKTHDSLEEAAKSIDSTVEEISTILDNMMSGILASYTAPPEASFLRNPVKTSQFIQHVWNRTSSEILKAAGVDVPAKESPKKRFSIFSLKSAWSNLSISSSTSSLRNNNGKSLKALPVKVDVLLSYCRRQVTSILHEVCNLASKDATQYKLPFFQDAIKKFLKPKHIKIIDELDIGSVENEQSFLKFGKPVSLQMDMLAYSFDLMGSHIGFEYFPENIREDLENFSMPQGFGELSVEVTGKSGTQYLIVSHIIRPTVHTRSRIKNLLKKPEQPTATDSGAEVLAIFPGCIHKDLANRQVFRLISLLIDKLESISHLYM